MILIRPGKVDSVTVYHQSLFKKHVGGEVIFHYSKNVRVIKLENWSKMHGHNEIRGGSVCSDADFACMTL